MSRSIQDNMKKLSGVGPKRAEALEQLGVRTVYDLLTFYPFRYEDLTVKSIESIEDKEKVVLEGEAVSEGTVSYFGHKKSRFSFRLNVEKVIVPVTFFNQPYLKQYVHAGELTRVFGVWDARRMSLTGIKLIGQQKSDHEAVYSSNKQINQHTIFKLIKQAWDQYQSLIPDYLPADIIKKYGLMPFSDAIRTIHFPTETDDIAMARKTLIFFEFLLYQLKLNQLRKSQHESAQGQINQYDIQQLKGFFANLSFELTDAQKRVVNEISKDLLRPIQMFRLLQGDVGSGKTIVAAASLFSVWTAGKQTALMAPTEILAEQHFHSLSELFAQYDLKIALLTGSLTNKEKYVIYEQLQSGELDGVIGTHALIQEQVQFQNLGLIIIDEQHRFGVNQRKMLREKGDHPDVLFMTATPIPRTLSITAFGEMDISVIDEMPPGRQPVKTIWIRPQQTDQLKQFIAKQLAQNSQVYVISPLIEESEHLDVQNVTDLHRIYSSFFPNHQVGLLHGQMSAEEKQHVIQQFADNEMQILVSTTVIEVGVNVPNATLMIIHDADRFGLAQLHQLRGRVGRGSKKAHCVLIADPKTESGIERMQTITEVADGFQLSERDLQMRGPGEVFGHKQSGLPEFKIGDIVEHAPILEEARTESILLLNDDERLNSPAYKPLYEAFNQDSQATLD